MNIDYKYSFYPTDESLSWTLADSELEFKKNFEDCSRLITYFVSRIAVVYDQDAHT